MSIENYERAGCRDVFHSYLLENANYVGNLELPAIKTNRIEIPTKLVKFSEIFLTKDYDAYVHFYQDDCKFERIWNNPLKYFKQLKKFKGVIAPDFSVYRDMPLIMQFWNIFRSRAIAQGMIDYGINVIPNIRYGDERTYGISCEGIEKNSIIAVGSHGCIKGIEDRKYFIDGFDFIIKQLQPKIVILYGSKPNKLFNRFENLTDIIQFKDSFYSKEASDGDR